MLYKEISGSPYRNIKNQRESCQEISSELFRLGFRLKPMKKEQQNVPNDPAQEWPTLEGEHDEARDPRDSRGSLAGDRPGKGYFLSPPFTLLNCSWMAFTFSGLVKSSYAERATALPARTVAFHPSSEPAASPCGKP
jgi:hypothetical protein